MSELSLRTNRFNASGERYTVERLTSLYSNSEYRLFMLKASDVYGDMGLVAMAVVHNNIIENFMLSCRIFGREFEIALLAYIKRVLGSELKAVYNETDKNHICKIFYSENGVTII